MLSNRQSGFTLVELVIVIVLLSILSGIFILVIQGPIRMWAMLGERAELTAVTESVLQLMSREIRSALPNSVRINAAGSCTAVPGSPCAIEFMHTIEGGKYRAFPPPFSDKLNFTSNTDQFEVLGGLDVTALAAIDAGGAGSGDCMNGGSDCLVIYNTGSPVVAPGVGGMSNNAWLGPGNPGSGIAGDDFFGNIASVSNAIATHISFNNSDLVNWHFPSTSPGQRFYIIDTPVSFVCNLTTGQITRHQNYVITAAQSSSPGGTSNLLADHVTACQFNYNAAASTRNGLVTLEIKLTSDNNESVWLMQQAHVSNLP